ncbi:hypothetical protein PLESTM_001999700 [Pleodorina starrii]|nr:hypothetical protein PLESTM_001999700 [Pleodorina starrii]
MRRVLKRVFQRSETKADVPGADDAEVNDTDANSSYSIDSDSSTTLRTSRPKAPGTQPPDIFKSAAEVAGAPTATPPAIYQAIQAVPVPQPMAAPTPVMADPSQQATPSLQIPPRDHVAPKSYESVTIAVGRNCPQGLRRAVWHVTDFDLRKLMYNGAISMVYHAVDKRSGITVALKLYKRIKLNEIERHQVAREIRLHSDLAHDSIIALYAAWKDKAYVYLALEWAPGGDVYSYLKSQRGRLAEELAVPLILEPFMAGLAVIHEKGLIHRDIKPENMLLTNSFQVKIADFGLSIDSKQEIANTRLGTIDYLAPEILDCPVKQHPEDHKDRPDTGYTNKVDCWSVGVLAYELLVGQPPFAAPTAQETLRLIRTKRVEYPSWLSPESVNFMSIVLVRDPTLRPAIAELLDHPWIAKYSRREGGGLARARNRLQQRRPTVDGGMLVRSLTGAAGVDGAAAAAAAAAGGGGGGNFATTSLPYDMLGSGASVPIHGSSPMGSPPAAHPQMMMQQHPPGSLLPPATGARGIASPDKNNAGSFSRKLKFWSMAPSGGSGSGAAAAAAAGPMSVDAATAAAAAAFGGGGGGDSSMHGSPTSGNSSTGRVVPLPSPTGGNTSPSLFARLTSGRTKSSAGTSPQAQPGSPTAAPGALLAGLTPGSGGSGGGSKSGGGGYDGMQIDSGSGVVRGSGGVVGGGASSAVPPVTPDAPTSPMSLFRPQKMNSMAPGGSR